MAQTELTPIIKLKPALIPELVAALCAKTGLPEPTPEPFTGPQLKLLVLRSLQLDVQKYRAEHPNPIVEGVE